MPKETESLDFLKSKWLTSVVLVVTLYLIYAPTFLTDYLMFDEWAYIGRRPNPLRQTIINHFLFNSRPIFGILNNWVFEFVGYNPFRIQMVRFLGFLSMAGIAVALLQFLEKRSHQRWFSFFVILFFFSQAPFQGLQGYSLLLISNSQPSIWLSLAAFYLFFFVFRKWQISTWLQVGVVFLLLLLAMHTMQTYAFFAMIPLSYLALTDWKHQKRRILSFFIIAIVVFVLSSLVYKFASDFSRTHAGPTYPLTQQTFSALRTDPIKVILNALNPQAYWNAFEMWTFPFPFHYTMPLGPIKRRSASMFLMLAWSVLILAAIVTEIKSSAREEKRDVLLKWLAVLGAMGFGALFIVADAPTRIIDHRPHMALLMTGIAIFSGAYSLQVLAATHRFWRSRAIQLTGALLVIFVAFGAQADVLRGIVYTRQAQIDFLRTAMMVREPAEYEKVIVILPQNDGCVTEPCDPWFGQIVHSEWHMQRPQVYQYALATIGAQPDEKTITFVKQRPGMIPDDAILIDWNQFVDARQRLGNYLHLQRR